jgi:hypothetical protein
MAGAPWPRFGLHAADALTAAGASQSLKHRADPEPFYKSGGAAGNAAGRSLLA